MVIEVCVGEPVENGSSVIVIPFHDLVVEIVIPLWKIEPIVFFLGDIQVILVVAGI
jgi:hypothetical protein